MVIRGTAEERRRTPGGWARGAGTSVPRDWLAARSATERPAAVILFALSRLDLLNAAHGRRAGDAVVKAAQRRLSTIADARNGTVARLGGGRFALMVEVGGTEAKAIANEAAEALARPFDGGIVVGSRAGIAVLDSGEDAPAALGRAGEALGMAEAGAPVLAEPARAASLDALAIDLHHAIAREEIDILFQPQVRIEDGAIVGVEALARWRHPRLGSLGADELFAAAARADLGLALSEHIQGAALREAAAWPPALDGLRLSLNITPGDVARPDFAAALLDRAYLSGFAASRLTVELTETRPLVDVAQASAALAILRAAGCRIAIDDFGSGYSSLAYVRALPLDTVKLDRSLIEGIAPDTREARLVGAAVAMAATLGLSVIAEGVETQIELDILAQAECEQYQGYLCAPPLDTPTLIILLGRR